MNQNNVYYFEMGTKHIDNDNLEMKMICEKCHKEFSENELDLCNGKWLCNDCEQLSD